MIPGQDTEVMFIKGSLGLYIQVQLLFKKIILTYLCKENRKGVMRLEEDIMKEGVKEKIMEYGIHVIEKLKGDGKEPSKRRQTA